MQLDLDRTEREMLDTLVLAGTSALRWGVEKGLVKNLPSARALIEYGEALRKELANANT